MTKLHDFRTNFRFGRVKEGLRVRQDAKAYEASLRDCENLRIMIDGSVERRPGTKYIQDLAGEARIEPWAYSASLNFLLVFTNTQLVVIDTSDDSTVATLTGQPWTSTNMWFNKLAFRRDQCVITNADFQTRILEVDAAGAVTIRKLDPGGISGLDLFEQVSKELPMPFFDFAGVKWRTNAPFSLAEPLSYSEAFATAQGAVIDGSATIAVNFFNRDLDGTLGDWWDGWDGINQDFMVIQTDADALPLGVTPITEPWNGRLRAGDGEVIMIGNNGAATQAQIVHVGKGLRRECDVNPFFIRNGSSIVEVTLENHQLNAGDEVFIAGISTASGEQMSTILTGACRFESTPTGTAKNYTVHRVIDANTFEIDGDANATVTELQGGADVLIAFPQFMPGLLEPAFNDRDGWPQTCEFHEGRLWLGSTNSLPDAAWASSAFDIENFEVSTGEVDEAFALYGVTNQTRIVELVSQFDLMVLSEAGEYFIPGSRNGPVTAETVRVVPAGTQHGAAYTDAHVFDGGVFFVDANGKAIRELTPDETVDQPRYKADAVTQVIEDWVLSPRDSTRFNGEADDASASLIYVNETDEAALVLHAARSDDMFGWMKWTIDGDRGFVSMAGVRTKLYAVVRDVATYKLVQFDSSIEELDIRTALDTGVQMPFFAEISPPRAATGQGSKAGKMLNLVDTEVHWKNTEVGTVEGETILEPTDTIVDEWRHYVVGIWDREPVLRIEGTGTGGFGMRAVTLNVYF